MQSTMRRDVLRRWPLDHPWVFVITVHLVAGLLWLSGTLLLRQLAPDAVRYWDLGWGVWAAAFLAMLLVPAPFEPALLAAQGTAEEVVAVLATALGLSMAAAVAYLVGDLFRSSARRYERRSRVVRAILGATRRIRGNWVYAFFGVLLAVPGMIDSGVVYVFAILGLRLWPFLLAVFLSGVVRAILVLMAAKGLGL